MKLRAIPFILICLTSLAKAESLCAKTLSYQFGQVDSGFNVTRQELVRATSAAVKLWHNALGENKFYYSESGELTINLIYTSRQDVVEAIKLLQAEGKLVQDSVKDFNYNQAELNRLISSYNNEANQYEFQLKRYNSQVEQYNDSRSSNRAQYMELEKKGAFLRDWQIRLHNRQNELKELSHHSDLNRKVVSGEVGQYEFDRAELKSILDRMPAHDRAGEYVVKNGNRVINLYVVRSLRQLELLLAHELGHALGIRHVNSPRSLMYFRETEYNTNLDALSAADTEAFRGLCR